MAAIFRRKGSRFYYIQFRDPDTGRTKKIATKFLAGVGTERRKAEAMAATKTIASVEAFPSRNRLLWDWVEAFLITRHASAPGTLRRKLTIWKTLSLFLSEQKLSSPELLRRQHCLAYFPWRIKHRSFRGTTHKPIGHNTVLLELKVLSSICREAVIREYISANPCASLGIGKAPAREKSEMTDEDIQLITSLLAARCAGAKTPAEIANAEFLRVSFQIALHQVCRMNETHLHLTRDVDMRNLTIALSAKGGKRYIAPMNPALVPLFKELIASRRIYTYEKPRMGGLLWFEFFDGLRRKYPGRFDSVSFHSTRVTGISRLERGGVPEGAVMKLVGHASTTVHRVYRKLHTDEYPSFWSALHIPSSETLDAPASNPTQPAAPSASRG